MVTVYDISPTDLVPAVAEKLKKIGIKEPEFIGYVKSGPHKDRRPEQGNFWYLRLASLLRQAYMRENVGVNRLRTHYGGRKNMGTKKHHSYKAGGSIIRKGLQALEENGLVKKSKTGRSITGKGKSLLDQTAKEVTKPEK